MSEENRSWAETPVEERKRRWQRTIDQDPEGWLAKVIRVMCDLGCGYGKAMELVRQQEQQGE